MASSPEPVPINSAAVRLFAAEHFAESGAARFGIDVAGLAEMLTEVLRQRGALPLIPTQGMSGAPSAEEALRTLHLEELVLTRACMAGHNGAWELFLTRYRVLLFDAAHAIAHDESTARVLADSLYAELYGLSVRGEVRASKLRYYLGRGSLGGWLRTVVAQEYVNQYRRTRRETSLDAELEQGRQFAAETAETPASDTRVDHATAAELASLGSEERFLLASYFLDRRTLAEIAKSAACPRVNRQPQAGARNRRPAQAHPQTPDRRGHDNTAGRRGARRSGRSRFAGQGERKFAARSSGLGVLQEERRRMSELPRSVREALARQTAADEHPSADLLNGFVEHALAADENARVTTHLSACADCREIVFLASSAVEEPRAGCGSCGAIGPPRGRRERG